MAIGTAVAAGTWFLYKTKKGEKLRAWWEKYFNELRDEWEKLKAEAEPEIKPRPAKKKSLPAVKKNLFLKSGKPLVK